MQRILSIIALNVVIFIALIGLLEIFVRLNENFGWLQKEELSPYIVKPYLSTDDVKKKYGPLEIPTNYKAEHAYNWAELRQAKYKSEFSQATYPNHYYSEFLRKTNFSGQQVSVMAQTNKSHVPIYTVTYDFDENGLRKVEQSLQNKYSEYFIALGCSLTFGEGVPSGFDYPSQLATKARNNIRIYNYGFHGAGPNDFYQAIKEDKKFFSAIKEKTGIAAWLFIPDHLERFFCSTNCQASRSWILDKPNLELVDHNIIYRTKFKDSYTPRRVFYRFLSSFHLLNYFNFILPLEYSKENIELFVKTFLVIKKDLEEKHQLQRFIFINYLQFPQQKMFVDALRSSGIEVLDYSDIPFSALSTHFQIPIDRHNTSEFNWLLTEMLAQDLNLKN